MFFIFYRLKVKGHGRNSDHPVRIRTVPEYESELILCGPISLKTVERPFTTAENQTPTSEPDEKFCLKALFCLGLDVCEIKINYTRCGFAGPNFSSLY